MISELWSTLNMVVSKKTFITKTSLTEGLECFEKYFKKCQSNDIFKGLFQRPVFLFCTSRYFFEREKKCVNDVKISRCFFKAPPVEVGTINCWQVQGQNIVVNIRARTKGMAQETEIFVNFSNKYLWIFTNN